MPLFVGTRRILRPVPSSSAGDGSTPVFVAVGTKASAAGTLSVPYYAGVAANHIALIIAAGYNDVTFGEISGWNSETQVNSIGMHAKVYWKRLTGGESGSESITGATSNANHAVMLGFSGCTTSGTPYEDFQSNSSDGSTSNTSDSTTTTGPNRLLVRFYTDEAGGISTTPPASWTERYEDWDTVPSMGFNRIAVDTIEQATAGTVSATTRSTSFSSSLVNFSLALLPNG